ncbi:phage tail protein [uncultured Enterovirga sp.]|uniref:phage tail protein n=1 Tax=uncultured Enterovirga sp. TaxID=2026352 RepID=UPI0035CC3EEC
MAEPFLSEIRIMSFGFAPKGWALCNGQLLPINQNQALFALLGTTFGGDGRVNFALPNLQGSTPIHVGAGHPLGQRAGEQAHTLAVAELPTHTHGVTVNNGTGTATVPNGAVLAKAPANTYGPPTQLVAMGASSVVNTGGSQPHLNMQPFLVLNFCIALQGIFPSPN